MVHNQHTRTSSQAIFSESNFWSTDETETNQIQSKATMYCTWLFWLQHFEGEEEE